MYETERDTSSRLKVYRYVKDCIISQELRPGAIIHERDLAQKIGVSRTPVREALRSLQDDGWLTVMPRRGTVVRPLCRREIEEVLQLRTIIGAAGIKLSVGRISAGAFAHLRGLIAQQEIAAASHDCTKFIDADMQLHIAMVRLAGNSRLSLIAEDLLDNFRRVALEAVQGRGDLSSPLTEHKAIVAALENEDQVTAETILINHVEAARQALLPRS